MSYEVGQRVRLSTVVSNESGTPTDATVTITVYREDGTQYAGVVANHAGSPGSYFADVTLDTPGRLTWEWVSSGAVVGRKTDQSYVREPFIGLMSLHAAKVQLNKSLTDTSDDDELLDWIDAITRAIERYTGPIIPRVVVETYTVRPLQRSIVLRRRPVLEVLEVREFWGPGDIRNPTVFVDTGPTYADDAYYFDPGTSSVMRYGSGYPTNWPVGYDNVRITYRAGRTPVPQNLRLASKELLTHVWRQSQITGGTSRPVPRGTGESLGDRLDKDVQVPARVLTLIGYRRAPLLGG